MQNPEAAGADPKTTRPEGAQGVVSAGGIDELLDETPECPEHRRGRFDGVNKGRKVRWMLTGLAVMVPLGLWLGVQAIQAGVEARRFDVPFAFEKPQGDAATMVWNEGKARLGLHVDGVTRIQLPDAVIELREGDKHAQVWVEVVDGKVVRIKVLVGKVVVRREGVLVR